MSELYVAEQYIQGLHQQLDALYTELIHATGTADGRVVVGKRARYDWQEIAADGAVVDKHLDWATIDVPVQWVGP